MDIQLNEDGVDQSNVDELIEGIKPASDCLNQHQTRTINLILDHSAFVRGIGNIKRWFNLEYINSNLTNKQENIQLNIYIPSYTLHEFDFVKKGTSMMATNAREAIRFIDRIFEREDIKLNGSTPENVANPLNYGIFIESPMEAGPSWNECLNYKIHSPKVKEFPNFKTKFDSNLIGQQIHHQDDDLFNDDIDNSVKVNDIQYENSQPYQNALANSDNQAEMPIRLRYLIRSCIYKRFIDIHNLNKPKSTLEDWKLVTEDPITKIWIKSFGIDCLNVNDAELLIFKNYDVNQFNQPAHLNFSLQDGYDNSKNILQNTIDTTKYDYTNFHDYKNNNSKNKNKNKNNTKNNNNNNNNKNPNKKKNKNKETSQPKKQTQPSNDPGFINANGELIKKEKFGVINFAPRGSGELWKP